MKIRWSSGSVRLRITPREMQTLTAGEALREELRLAGGAWVAELRVGSPEATVDITHGVLQLTLSSADVAKLSLPESEGVYFGDGASGCVRYLVEKDFPCVHPRPAAAAEPESETFPAPAGFDQRNGCGS